MSVAAPKAIKYQEDPPYALDNLASLPDLVLGRDILYPEGYFILEHPDTYSFTGDPRFVKEKKYGNVHFSFFIKSSENR